MTFRNPASVSQWSYSRGRFFYEKEIYQPDDPNLGFAFADLSFDKKYYILTEYGKTFQVLDLSKNSVIQKVVLEEDFTFYENKFSYADYLMAQRGDKKIQIWNYLNNKKVLDWTFPDHLAARDIFFLPKSNMLLFIACIENETNYFDLFYFNCTSFKQERTQRIFVAVNDYAFSCSLDENYLVCYSPSTSVVSVWNFKTFQALYEIKLSNGENLSRVIFTKDNKRFLSCVSNSTIKSN